MRAHKANYKDLVSVYLGFGEYAEICSPVCVGAKAMWNGQSFKLVRNWKDVTCKHCLKRRPK